jgi:hypothetical protein
MDMPCLMADRGSRAFTPIIQAMPTSIRRASGGKSPRLAGPSAGSAALADKPFLRFHHSAPLRRKTLSVVYVLEQAENPVAHADELANLVVDLTNAGLDAYFMQPLKLAKPGFVVEQSASLGMVGVQQVLGTVIRRVIGRMNGAQLLSVCGSIGQFMR